MSLIKSRDLQVVLLVSTLASALGCGASVDRDALAKDFVSRADYDKLLTKVQALTTLVDSETARAKQAEQAHSDEVAKLNSPPANGQATAVVRTKRLEIVNDKGDVVALATAGESGGLVAVRNNDREVVAILAAKLGAKAKGHGYLSVLNAAGNEVGLIGTDDDGAGKLDISNDKGDLIATCGNDQEGGLFFIANHAGKPVVSMGALRKKLGSGYCSVHNATGEKVVTMGANTEGRGTIVAWDADGKLKFLMDVNETGAVVKVNVGEEKFLSFQDLRDALLELTGTRQ